MQPCYFPSNILYRSSKQRLKPPSGTALSKPGQPASSSNTTSALRKACAEAPAVDPMLTRSALLGAMPITAAKTGLHDLAPAGPGKGKRSAHGIPGPGHAAVPPIIHAIGLVVKETADELCSLRPRPFRRAEALRRIPASPPRAPPARDGMAQAAEPLPLPACIPPRGWTALLQKVFDAGSRRPRPKAGHARLPALSISAARFSRRPQRCIPVF